MAIKIQHLLEVEEGIGGINGNGKNIVKNELLKSENEKLHTFRGENPIMDICSLQYIDLHPKSDPVLHCIYITSLL